MSTRTLPNFEPSVPRLAKREWPLRSLLLLSLIALSSACSTFRRGPDPADLLIPTSPALSAPAPEQYFVRFQTSRGDFLVEVNRAWAPLGADRFYNLVRHGYYDSARFFRVLPDFVVQFGIPADTTLSRIWSGQQIPDDSVSQSNQRGFVSFASGGPGTRTAQVFINLADNRRLDGLGFAPFARVIEGMEVVDDFYAGYGEGAPRGRGPAQDRMEAEGNAYLEREFPLLDYIVSARVVSR